MTCLRASLFLMIVPLLGGCPLEDWFGGEGELSLLVTDAPADDVVEVRIEMVAVELLSSSRSPERFTFDAPVVIENLLDLTGGVTRALLSSEEVQAGPYIGLRLYFSADQEDGFVVEQGGGEFPLYVAGQQLGLATERPFLEVLQPFDVEEDELTTLVLDMDLRRSLLKPTTTYYQLWPAFRLVERDGTGTISGTVAAPLLQEAACDNDLALDTGNAVYLYETTRPANGDIFVDTQGLPLDDTNPVMVAPVRLDADGSYTFTASFAPEGSYALGLTCSALRDNPQTDELLPFVREASTTLRAGGQREVNFGL